MAGNRTGGLKTARHLKERYGEDFYVRIGAMGGSKFFTKPKGFAYDKRSLWQKFRGVPSRAQLAGRVGGTISKRRKK